MTKTETKHKAQEELMRGMVEAIRRYRDSSQNHGTVTSLNKIEEMTAQFKRVEKLFGYDKDSWSI